MATKAALAAAIVVCALAAGASADTGVRFTEIGAARGIDLRWNEFELASDSAEFRVLASRAVVRFEDGRQGALRDINEGALVRVFGERVSSRSVRADEVMVLDNDARRLDPRPRSYRPDERIEIEGVVTRVLAGDGEIDIRVGDRDFTVILGPGTVIRRYLYVTDIGEVREGDRLGVYGTVRDTRITASRVHLIEAGQQYRPLYLERREDVVEGEIVVTTSSFDRTLSLATDFGERKVDVKRGADVTRDGQPVSVHDLRRGELVRASGVWDGGSLVASRVEVIREIDRSAPSVEDPARPEPGAGAEQQPSEPASPAEPAAEESSIPAAPAERTGRIVDIEHQSNRMTIDTGLSDVQVDARDATVRHQGSTRRFSDLKKGDKVTVTGETRDGVFVAESVEIVE